ncbi:MAG: hypothetical protein SF052_21800 [Bacteroidia bacterium]|nr:hypothetical protein [Bacteroidia bacterium]
MPKKEIKSARLIQMLRALTEKEFRDFRVFVKSPWFNRNERLINLTEYLYPAWPDFDKKTLEREKIFAVLYGDQTPCQEQQVYDHFSFLIRLLETFFVQQSLDTDTAEYQRLLLSAFSAKNLENHFDRYYSKVEQEWEKNPFQGTDFFLEKYRIQREAVIQFGKQQKRETDQHLPHLFRSLDQFYLSSRLRFTCEWLNRANILHTEPVESVILPLRSLLNVMPLEFLENPSIKGYYRVFQILTGETPSENYPKLVQLLKEHSDQIPREEINELYAHAQNFCIKMINQGQADYHSHLFQLFQDLLDQNLLIENGHLDHRKYKNIVTVGLRMRAFDWVWNFLHEYREKLSPEYRENVFTYNLAAWHYELQQYHQALPLLNQVSFTDVYYHLSAKAMMLKIYFEMEEDLAFESLLDTFRIFLNRNRTISAYQRTVHKNMIRFAQKAYRLRNKQGILSAETLTQETENLRAEINSVREVANINWLVGEIAKMGGGKF